MGWNSTVVVYHDALDQIKNDPDFGRNLAEAISGLPLLKHHGKTHADVQAGNHSNAAMVVESHHADSCAVVTVAGNLGICHVTAHGWDHHKPEGAERMLRAWADKLGFELVRRASLD